MHARRFPNPFLPFALLFFLHLNPLSVRCESPAKLGPAPRATETMLPESVGPGYVRAVVAPIDNSDRSDVADAFDAVYRAAQGIAANWTGNVGTCTAGTTSQDYIDATLLRVNYYRAMVGLPGNVVFDSTFNQKCSEAALMMIANSDLSHNPPPTWTCYTAEGAEAAGKSNIAIGRAGPESIDLYILDSGPGNTAVGHRRWILYPPQQTMGTGSSTAVNGFFNGSNALWVLASMGTRPATPEWVAWPPAGYVPIKSSIRAGRFPTRTPTSRAQRLRCRTTDRRCR